MGVVAAAVGQPVQQSRVAVEGEDDGPVLGWDDHNQQHEPARAKVTIRPALPGRRADRALRARAKQEAPGLHPASPPG